MEQARENRRISTTQKQDWAWIGMEDEASRLQMAVCCLPPEERGTVSAGPFSTD